MLYYEEQEYYCPIGCGHLENDIDIAPEDEEEQQQRSLEKDQIWLKAWELSVPLFPCSPLFFLVAILEHLCEDKNEEQKYEDEARKKMFVDAVRDTALILTAPIWGPISLLFCLHEFFEDCSNPDTCAEAFKVVGGALLIIVVVAYFNSADDLEGTEEQLIRNV